MNSISQPTGEINDKIACEHAKRPAIKGLRNREAGIAYLCDDPLEGHARRVIKVERNDKLVSHLLGLEQYGLVRCTWRDEQDFSRRWTRYTTLEGKWLATYFNVWPTEAEVYATVEGEDLP